MIGKTIVSLLTGNADLLALVPETSIFPYVATENTPLPLIIYTIDSLQPEYTKTGWAGDDWIFSVAAFSEDYANLQDIVKEVREALELQSGTNTWKIILSGFVEGFNINESVFVNRLTFQIRCNTINN